MVRNIWLRLFNFNWKLGIQLILFFGVLRFAVVMNAIESKSFSFVSIVFIVMALSPFLLLTKEGRKKIGMRKPASYRWIGISLLYGIGICILFYLAGVILFSKTNSNWFFYIGSTYPIDYAAITVDDKMVYFIIFSIIGMTFSPFGEELMYRGLIHQSMVSDLGEKRASIIDSAAFAVTHLAHFGLIYNKDKWQLLVVPSMLWIALIFSTGLLFNYCKYKSGSILGAILCHAAFNFTMTYFIFYHLF